MKKEGPVLTADSITDVQIRALREDLFAGPADARQLHGLVACWDALGRSHRRGKARAHCAALINGVDPLPSPAPQVFTKRRVASRR